MQLIYQTGLEFYFSSGICLYSFYFLSAMCDAVSNEPLKFLFCIEHSTEMLS